MPVPSAGVPMFEFTTSSTPQPVAFCQWRPPTFLIKGLHPQYDVDQVVPPNIVLIFNLIKLQSFRYWQFIHQFITMNPVRHLSFCSSTEHGLHATAAQWDHQIRMTNITNTFFQLYLQTQTTVSLSFHYIVVQPYHDINNIMYIYKYIYIYVYLYIYICIIIDI